MIRVLAIVFLVLFAGGASAQSVSFPSVAVGSSAAGPEVKGWIYKPAGDGPVPRDHPGALAAPARTRTPTSGASCW